MSVSRQMETKKTKQIEVDEIIIDSYFKTTIFLYEMKKNSFSNIKHQWIIGIFHIYSLVFRDNISIDYWNLYMQLRFPLKTNLSRRNVLSGR